ncbi:hypothetical protein DAI22_04g083350 [Oryza sativa Japonica Group]|nr:hypothetical protein DAI22_04g083350 [Oryza sativa Japonica Group]
MLGARSRRRTELCQVWAQGGGSSAGAGMDGAQCARAQREVGWCGRERIRSSSDRRNRGRKGWGWTEGGLCATWLSSEGRPAAGVQREADWLQRSPPIAVCSCPLLCLVDPHLLAI